MELIRKYGLEMQLPEGKMPGFYAQIIKGIAERAPLFDRYKELLIFDSPELLPAAEDLLNHYRVPAERCELLLLPMESMERGPLFEDYVLVSRAENGFADLTLTAAFSLTAAKPDAEPAPALQQLDEHLIGSFRAENGHVHLIDRQLAELAEKIAQVYSCGVEWRA